MPGDKWTPPPWGNTVTGTTDQRDYTPQIIGEAARYNALAIRDMADVLYHYQNVNHDTRALVAALDAAIAVQVCLTDMLEPTDRKTA